LPGPIYDPLHVKELHYGAYALVHGNQAGGTSVGLLKALAYGTCVVSLNTADNAYVVRQAGLLYEPTVDDLRAKLQFAVDHADQVQAYRRKAVERIGTEYLWDTIADTYEELLVATLRNGKARAVAAAPARQWAADGPAATAAPHGLSPARAPTHVTLPDNTRDPL
jgi:hypothetical protein